MGRETRLSGDGSQLGDKENILSKGGCSEENVKSSKVLDRRICFFRPVPPIVDCRPVDPLTKLVDTRLEFDKVEDSLS